MIQVLFAFLAGILTVGAPCVLPLLPILLGVSIGQKSKTRPLFIALGFAATFSLAGLTLSSIVQHLGISPDVIRDIAVFALGLFAVFIIWPRPFELLAAKMGGAINLAGRTAQKAGSGNLGGFVLGLILGIVWTPCAGPVLASILTLIAIQGSSFNAGILLIAYSLGAGLPMLFIAYGGQYLSGKITGLVKYSVRLQQVFGVLILLLAAAMYFQYDTKLQAQLAQKFPGLNLEEKLAGDNSQSNNPLIVASGQMPDETNQKPQTLMKINLDNYGPAPEFTGIGNWLNTGSPLTLKDLKGKVVLVDFWTYSCINCIRTLPFVTKWYDTYKDKGFVVVGVHTPEFEFEKVTDNVKTAVDRFNIHYPVAQDNNYQTWQAYHNQYWPAEYLIDQNGNVVYTHFGEGNYDHTENIIRQMLGLDMDPNAKTGSLGNIQSPEMYFELPRLRYLAPEQSASAQPKTYALPAKIDLNTFALSGDWQFDSEKATTLGPASIRLKFNSGKVFMVASANKPVTLQISVDGQTQKSVTVQASQLYTLFDSNDYSEHTIDIQIPEQGFNAFTFTFG